MPGNCHFQDIWLQEDEFKAWLKKTSDTGSVFCRFCRKDINISSMGRTALKSHMKGKTHTDYVHSHKEASNTNRTLDSFFSTPNDKNSADENVPSTTVENASARSLSEFVCKNDVLTAEIWQCLKTVDCNQSFCSNNDSVFVFQQMFPDSNIAKRMNLAETKCMYLTCFGIAPYLSKLVEKHVKDSAYDYVMLFDESLNKEIKKKQLDIFVRHWNHDKVCTRYLTSDFLGHSCASELIDTFESKVEEKLGFSNLIQVSMDGPNVNWCAFDRLQSKIKEDTGKKLIDIGSCGLHTVHNAFRAAVEETGWGMSGKLYGMYKLFEDVPARREDYESVTVQTMYPLRFCAHRWVENIQVCERAMKVLPHMSRFVENVKSKKIKNPGTKSYESVVEFCSDKFAFAKMAFIISVAKPVELFLKKIQSDKPLVPFLYNDLESLITDTMSRFVKSDIMNIQKLASVEFDKKENQKLAHRVRLGFVVDEELKKLNAQKKVSERQVLEFRNECLVLLLTLTRRLMSKSPLNKSIVKNLACLLPGEMCADSDRCADRFRKVLNSLVSCKQIDIQSCDEIQSQYERFVQKVKESDDIKFSPDKERLDTFYFDNMKNDKYDKVWPVVARLLVLSHGQATVERGFSINKEVTEVNLTENNLIALRVIKDHISFVGGIRHIVITKELLNSAQHARQLYHAHLDKNRLEQSQAEKSKKRKLVENEVETLKKKKVQLNKDLNSLYESVDKNLEKAETKQSLTFVSHANALRKKAKEKDIELKSVDEQLQEKEMLLKHM